LPPLQIPATDLTEVNALWQVLAVDCRALSIMWTDGDASSGTLAWYGVDYTMNPGTMPNDYTDDYPEYFEVGSDPADPDAWIDIDFLETDPSQINFDLDSGTDNIYRALWTHHNQNNWPVAIKIRFELLDTRDAEKPSPKTYEVICPIGG